VIGASWQIASIAALAWVASGCTAATAAGEAKASAEVATAEASAAAPVAASPPEPVAAAGSENGDGLFGFDEWDSDAPLSIESEELDIEQEGGRRRLVFGGNVRATQGDLNLRSARLVATYPKDGSEPELLEASGDVRLAQRDQKARCDGAVFDRVRDTLTCRGDAAFRDGDSCLAGKEIVIDLRRDTVRVTGGATVLINPEGEACGL